MANPKNQGGLETAREELLSALRNAASKLLRTRALESAAVCAAVTGLCAAAGQLGWAVGSAHPAAGTAICLLPLGPAAVFRLSRPVRKKAGLDLPTATVLSVVCVAASVLQCVPVLNGSARGLPNAILPFALLPLGAALGLAVRWIRGVSIHEVALLLDRCGALRERLATAAELSVSHNPDSSLTRCVYAQALNSYRSGSAGRLSMWRRTRATPAALGLIVLTCITLTFLPSHTDTPRNPEIRRIVAVIAAGSPTGRVKFAENFRRARRKAEGNPYLTAILDKAARAAELGDRGELNEFLMHLQREGVDLSSLVSGELSGMGDIEDAPNNSEAIVTASRRWGERHRKSTEELAGKGKTMSSMRGDGNVPLVRIYHPLYAGAAIEPHSGMSAAEKTPECGFVSYSDAWSAARERAVANIAAGKIPPEFRQLVRDYFRPDTLNAIR